MSSSTMELPTMIVNKCLVCNARNAKQHYGSWCCNGCKGFFWRTISSKRRYICMGSNDGRPSVKCEIQDGRRNSCRACRLKRCFDVGMDPNLIRDSWGKSTAFKQRNGQEEEEEHSPSPVPNTSATTPPMGMLMIKSENMMAQQQQPSTPTFHWKDSSNTMATSDVKPRNSLPISVKNIQLLADYLEWIQTMPELKQFSEQDKNVLVLNRARPSGWLLLAHQHLLNHPEYANAAAAASSSTNNFDIRTTTTTISHLEANKLEALEREIVMPLKFLDITPIELELLRLICFFSTVPQLSADGKKMVQLIQNTYSRSLAEFSLKSQLSANGQRNSFELASMVGSMFRANQIVHLLAVVEKIAHQYD